MRGGRDENTKRAPVFSCLALASRLLLFCRPLSVVVSEKDDEEEKKCTDTRGAVVIFGTAREVIVETRAETSARRVTLHVRRTFGPLT